MGLVQISKVMADAGYDTHEFFQLFRGIEPTVWGGVKIMGGLQETGDKIRGEKRGLLGYGKR